MTESSGVARVIVEPSPHGVLLRYRGLKDGIVSDWTMTLPLQDARRFCYEILTACGDIPLKDAE